MKRKVYTKNYSEAEYAKLKAKMWKVFDFLREYGRSLVPSELFLAGYIWGKEDLQIAGRVVSIMLKNADEEERLRSTESYIVRRQIPLIQKKFNQNYCKNLELDYDLREKFHKRRKPRFQSENRNGWNFDSEHYDSQPR